MVYLIISKVLHFLECVARRALMLSDSQGYGTLLMEEAERIAVEEHGSIKMAVISGMFGLSVVLFGPKFDQNTFHFFGWSDTQFLGHHCFENTLTEAIDVFIKGISFVQID